MANVSFEEETYGASSQGHSPNKAGLLGVVVHMGLAKDENEASTLLLWCAILGCLIAIGIFVGMYMNRPQGLDKNDIERIIQLQQQ